MNLLLCGLPKSGKTSLGKLLAKKMNYDFIDTDTLIEKAFGSSLSCREIFHQEGESVFRALETDQIRHLKHLSHTVIALGGGALVAEENWDAINEAGRLIYLEIPKETAWGRIKTKGIPAFLNSVDPKNHFFHIAEERMPVYAKKAHAVISTQKKTTSQILEELIRYGK